MLPLYDQLTNFNYQKTWTVGIFEKVTSLHKQQRKLDKDPTHIFTRIVRGRCISLGSIVLVSTNGRLHVMKLYRITNNKPHKGLSKIPDCHKGRGVTTVTNIETSSSTITVSQQKQKNKKNQLIHSERHWLTVLYYKWQYWYQFSYLGSLGSEILSWKLAAFPFGGYGLPSCFATSWDVPTTGLTPVIKRK